MKRVLKSNNILSIFNNYLYDSLLPININYLYNWGSILGISLVIQIVSGVFLGMYYIPNINMAFNSIDYIMREVNYGWLIRYIHANGAAFFFLAVYVHICRGILYGSYMKVLTWYTGIIIFLVMIITAFLGYTLVWGQMSMWAATVITNLLTTIPYIGNELVYLIWGGFSISNNTLNRFYSLHYLLPFIITGIVITHLIALHEVGGSNPLGLNKVTVNFNPYYSLQDILGFIIIILLLMIFVYISPNYLNHSDNYIPANPLVTPSHIVPEIYLLPFYAILRSIENKLMGVIAMILSIAILAILPYSNIHIHYSSTFRPLYKYITYLFLFNFILLTWIGQAIVANPYIIIGKLCTMFYFLYFILLIPIISFIELLLFLI